MRRFFIILGFIAAIVALILSVSPLFKIAYLPGVAALIFGLVAFYFSKQQQRLRKTVQLILMLTLISLILTTYKTVFRTPKVDNIEELELKEEASKKESEKSLKNLEHDDLDMDYNEPIIDTTEVEELY